MPKITCLLLMLVALTLLSCKEKTPVDAQTVKTVIIDSAEAEKPWEKEQDDYQITSIDTAEIAASVPLKDVHFNKRYKGQMGNRTIDMQLTAEHGGIKGFSYASPKSIGIAVTGFIYENDSVVIREFNSKGMQSGVFTGKLNSSGVISGSWMGTGESETRRFKLVEIRE